MLCHHCQKSADQESQLLQNLLPGGYSHLVCSFEALGDTNFKANLKLKLTNEDEVKKWQEEFQKSSGFTWRKSKTYPDVGQGANKYRVDLRCHHNTRGSSTRNTKNTSCRATMFLILKRQTHSQERKSRSEDPHIKEGYFFNVNLRNEHNHHVSCAEALQKRDVSRDVIEKLKVLFESGHSPSSALRTIKYELQQQEGDNYIYATGDRSVCPDIQFCCRLYYKLFKKARGAVVREEMQSDIQDRLDLYKEQQAEFSAKMAPVETDPGREDPSGIAMDCALAPVETDSGTSRACLEEDLTQVFESLKEKLRDDPSFTSPVTSFISSFNKLQTDSSLMSALSTFGKCPVAKSRFCQRQRGYLQTSSKIGVHPTVLARRKAGLGERRALIVGRPTESSMREHAYTITGRKRRTSHCLAHCVEANMSLGGTH
ncbi:hypothetical protein SKAU_G00254930 [Synaphobranchus kaupii]|uniref:Uncharacterized protein n=1 Tax=Synaphobranchus kaupii TaxID=118154 RepID=A0A9Q1IRZ1_SYNKA|nr:hypothetical protein SKAU_G00254930 [Synaphobranchus kaupii]